MVTDVNQAYCVDHSPIYTNIRSLYCTPEINILLHVNFISIKQNRVEEERWWGSQIVPFFQTHCQLNFTPEYCFLRTLFLLPFLQPSHIQHCTWTLCETCVCSKYVLHVKFVLLWQRRQERMVQRMKSLQCWEFIVLYGLWEGAYIFNSFRKWMVWSYGCFPFLPHVLNILRQFFKDSSFNKNLLSTYFTLGPV